MKNLKENILSIGIKYTSITCIVLLLFSCSSDESSQMEVKYPWAELIGSNNEVPFLPDKTANYFGQIFERNKNDRIGLLIKGEFPEARYMSFNVYDNKERSPVNNIGDYQIQPDDGSSNPFIDQNLSSNRSYTVLIAPDVEHDLNFKNELIFSDELEEIALFIRYYVPNIDDYGNVPLPEVYYINLDTGEPIDYDRTQQLRLSDFDDQIQNVANIIDLTEILQVGRKIEFYRFSGVGLYPNLDNQYLFSNVKLPPENIIMLKFRPPSYAETLQDISDADVRYYSMIIGDRLTLTYQTLYDDEFHIASDGFAYLVIGRPDEEILAKAAGLNFIDWPEEVGNKGLLIYRNLLTSADYDNNLEQVPDVLENVLDILQGLETIQASAYIGDYAPTGRKMKRKDFLENFDGFEVAY